MPGIETVPSPPASDTAAASAAVENGPIPSWMMGWDIPSMSQRIVLIRRSGQWAAVVPTGGSASVRPRAETDKSQDRYGLAFPSIDEQTGVAGNNPETLTSPD